MRDSADTPNSGVAATYVLASADDIEFGQPPRGYVTDAGSGVTTAHMSDGRAWPLGVPLCSGCDAPAPCLDCGL